MDRKLVVVTGGSSGVGRGIVLKFAELGCDVAFSFRSQSDAAARVADEVSAQGGRAIGWRCDVGDGPEVERFYASVQDWASRAPSVLVNNAGVQTWSPLLELSEASWDNVIKTNLKGCFLNTQAAAKAMVAAGTGGSIINIGSGSNKLAFPNLVDYTASKGGIEQLTKVSAVELGPHGITVNCVAPGAIIIERTLEESPDYEKTWAGVTPLGRVGTARDVAEAVAFFASDAASFITGQTIWVDGGAFTRATWPYL